MARTRDIDAPARGRPGNSAEAIAFLRECRDLLPPSHRPAFAAMLGRHESGVPLAEAFWIKPRAGGDTWREVEVLQSRNKKIADIRDRLLPGWSVKKAARAIAGERCSGVPAEIAAKIAHDLEGVTVPKTRQLEKILAGAHSNPPRSVRGPIQCAASRGSLAGKR